MSLQDVGAVLETTTVTLAHPDPRKTLKNPDDSPMTVLLHGPYSKRYRAAMRAEQQKMLASAAGGDAADTDVQDHDTLFREVLAQCIETWNIWETPDDKMDCTRENIDRLFDLYPWALDQLSAALGRAAGFLAPPNGR